MSRKRVLFTLTMPGVGSWNGRWSGEGRAYNLVRSLTREERLRAGIVEGEGRWSYAWDDGWRASVHARVMDKGERKPKSDGFLGYDWMVGNIVRWGTPYCQHEMQPDPTHFRADEGDWEQCKWCNMSRRLEAS